MLKKIFLYLAVLVSGLYIILALTCFTVHPDDASCNGVDVVIEDGGYGILTVNDIESLLRKKNLLPSGKMMNKISCSEIENAIKVSSLIEDCQCFKTHSDMVGIKVVCKIPIMQVFDKDGREFYIDKHGSIINGVPTALYLPVASGDIERDMSNKELLELALFLHDNRFWREQIEQIYFNSAREILLVPRVGNHIVELGKIDDIEKKLDKLKEFYDRGLNKIGWNKYSKLNIEFDNKVICTKRK